MTIGHLLWEESHRFQDLTFAAFTMAALAREAGLAKGTLYLYFRTKEELFLALLENGFGAWFDSMDRRLDNAQGEWTPERIADVVLASIAGRETLAIAAMVIQMAISRQREFKADAVGAQISGRPIGLANALRRLEAGARALPMHVSPAAAPLAQVNPLAAHGGGIGKLFSTHPPTEERVARLEALATEVRRAA
jgi:AcrR family transcriptional regulator